MGTTPDQLRNEIADTRSRLSRDADVLADKVRPGSIARRRTESMREGIDGMTGALRERVMGGASAVKESALSVKGSVAGMGDSVTSTAHSMTDRAHETPDALRQRAQGSPLAAGLIAFGVGALVSAMFPSSEPERRAAVAVRDRAEPALHDEMQELRSELQPKVQEALGAVKETASQGVSDTTEQLRAVGEDLSGQSAQSADPTSEPTSVPPSEAPSGRYDS